MRITLRLSAKDRERLACPEELTVDTDTMSMVEAITLQKGVELEPGVVIAYDTPGVWRMALAGRELHGPDGTVLMKDPEDGEAPAPRRVGDFAAELVLVWLALRQTTGRKVDLAGLEYEAGSVDWEIEIEDPADSGTPGKDESSPETTSP